MKNWSRKEKTFLSLSILLLAVQVIRPSKNTGNAFGPSDITTTVNVSRAVLSVLKRSCYDCHSNHTAYPWYDNITPVNWWVADHVRSGKREVNFTIFKKYKKTRQFETLEAIALTIEHDEMPLKSYGLLHPAAKLSSAEKKMVIDWAQAEKEKMNQRPCL